MERSLKRLGILTDSIGDLPDELVEKYGIEVLPVKIHIDEKTYLDKVDITDDEFFSRIQDANVVAKTSQPSPYDFQVAYERLLGEYDTILSIHASSELSGTFQSAIMAKEALGKQNADRLFLYDTGQASMGEGLVVLRAAEMAQAGAGVKEIAAELDRILKSMKTLFVPDTLTYLQRGGRIGKASALIGNILNIKPMLGLDKVVFPVEKIRGSKNVVPKLIDQLKAGLKPNDRIRACIISLNMPEETSDLEARIKSDGRAVEILRAKVGATIGCHVGPKVIGLIWHIA